jgi:amino acid permease
MMPIPYAFNLLGWSLGSAMLVGVALVSYWTMSVMVQVRQLGGSWVAYGVWGF